MADSSDPLAEQLTADLQGMRVDYRKGTLDHSAVDADAIRQFERWLKEAEDARVPEPNAMTVATATASGIPSARILLLKGVDARGFVFFTNYESRKGRELSENPRAALVFFWEPLERQVRVEGTVERVSREESRRYFDVRPRASRIGAWASRQSTVVPSRESLEQREIELDRQFRDQFGESVPLPEFWGGYRVVPSVIEFWQGRPSRLHDRLRYTRQGDRWAIERLSP
ncbi:MAG: pyridoxamine 5'-phosphate oxidase [Tepidisphaeraceae bacterium]